MILAAGSGWPTTIMAHEHPTLEKIMALEAGAIVTVVVVVAFASAVVSARRLLLGPSRRRRDAELAVLCPAVLAESPRWRWREHALYFSDTHGHRVMRISAGGDARAVFELSDDDPAGLGFLPDGRLLVAKMGSRSVVALELGGAGDEQPWADLREIQSRCVSDLCADGSGRAYVGGHGAADPTDRDCTEATTELGLADGSGGARSCASGLRFPTGMVITPDGRTLIAAEMFGGRLVAWDRDASTGALSGARTWAPLPGVYARGICLDAEGCVWVAFPCLEPSNAVVGEWANWCAQLLWWPSCGNS